MPTPELHSSDFANVDGRVRCPTDDCWGDLLLIPSGRSDEEGIPEFQPFTACPLCGNGFRIVPDMSGRDLWQRIAWLRANPLDE
jgi:hypothetical protein